MLMLVQKRKKEKKEQVLMSSMVNPKDLRLALEPAGPKG